MEYTIQGLSKLTGVSPRTLRYYDEIGLLKPARVRASGYRVYRQAEVDRLQHILFYRELGVRLESIKDILTNPTFNRVYALREHLDKLLAKKEQLDLLIANVNKTIAAMEGKMNMTDQEKFEGFKQNMIDENEAKYGTEIRAKYGNQAVEESNQKISGMTSEGYAEWEKLNADVIETLKAALATGDPASELAQKAAFLHRKWLNYAWGSYTKEAHAGLAQMYVDDPRFTAYYDRDQPGTAEFLRDAILIYTGMIGQ